jgi:1-acyl-sn-glycerol-3-phosphate acyltransferase
MGAGTARSGSGADPRDAWFRVERVQDRMLTVALGLLAPLVLAFLLFHMLWGIVVAGLLFPVLPAAACNFLIRFWSRLLLAGLGIRLEFEDLGGASRPPPAGSPGALLLTNHVSWADVFVLAAVIPVRFVAKSEVRSWPLAGWLAKAVGTVFIERGRRHAVSDVNRVVAARLERGQPIAVFPEGTTTDGSAVLRFHANLVHAALVTGAAVVPVALKYWQDERPSCAAAYVGDTSLAESLWRILVAPRLRVQLQLLPAVARAEGTRQEIAREAREAICVALGLPETDAVPVQGAEDEIDAIEPSAPRGS